MNDVQDLAYFQQRVERFCSGYGQEHLKPSIDWAILGWREDEQNEAPSENNADTSTGETSSSGDSGSSSSGDSGSSSGDSGSSSSGDSGSSGGD